ncbi:DUF5060 domain-containing protein [Asticcacaulis sp. BYS171W]|uniref:DUF5060 domain-containing protein n=1 Tax=Asticcacaulis aquaticus TaxID=2984212 RepID=A0ABT5HVR4_9CAUL|nr:DUF5060 domain-containing protein [Asticcacaulis aquaticus]MDC7684176.1 DUF5060 domain-containing protein [Asticcacaulis aquaticus]
MWSRRTVMVSAAASLALSNAAFAAPASVERWGVYEIALKGPQTGNPFDEVTLSAVFVSGARRVVVPGFYDGEGVYRVRFSPPETGGWSWATQSNIRALSGQTGRFEATAPTGQNHGPVRVTKDGYHFAYADGTPFRQIGTTCYAWAQQSDAKCAETLTTLSTSPFNKLRMCIFPNVTAESIDPFVRTGSGDRDWDAKRFDPAFFRRYEDRIRRLGALGIEADIILFHPYNKARGFSNMSRADDERYIRYVSARFSAYRNVWWAMGNEYDGIKTKVMDDWDHLFQVLQAADPHDRLRSIHNINVYYDHRKPWITHASFQNGSAVLDDARAQPYRNFAQKAVIFDEVCYEGNSVKRWGNLTGEQLVMRFWWGTIAGTYVGHSEAYSEPGRTDGSWLGQGGKLIGTSPPRLAFLKTILDTAPTPGIEPIETWYDKHMGGKPFEYYLRYFGAAEPTEWVFELPGRKDDPKNTYRVDIIDTWNMTITPVEGVFTMDIKDAYSFHDPKRPVVTLPGKKWIALRITRVTGKDGVWTNPDLD